jgi:hypothetical protein
VSRFWDDGDDGDYPQHWWQIDLNRALTSGRGKRLLQEVEDALLAMPKRELIEGWIVRAWRDDDDAIEEGQVCAVGAFAAYRKVREGKTWTEALDELDERWGGEQDDEWNTQALGRSLGLARTVAWYLAWINDGFEGDPKGRWEHVLEAVRHHRIGIGCAKHWNAIYFHNGR